MPEPEIQPFSEEHIEVPQPCSRSATTAIARSSRACPRTSTTAPRSRRSGPGRAIGRGRDPGRRARRLPARSASRRRDLGLEHLGRVRRPRGARARGRAGSVRGRSRGVGRARAATLTTRSCPRPTRSSSTRGSASRSAHSTRRRSRRPPESPDARRRMSSSGRAVAEDVDAATALDLELPRHQDRSPVFSSDARADRESPTRTGRSSCPTSTTRRSGSSSPRSTASSSASC